MASAASRNASIQIGITKTEEFMRDLPQCFSFGTDSKLHHDPRKVNVFSHKNDFFGDAYGEVLKVETLEEFKIVKQRLLKHPIYLRVHLERHIKQYQTRYITHADYVVFINTRHVNIQNQIGEMLDEAQELLENGKRFSIEFNFRPVLRAWFKQTYPCSYGSYIAKYSNFCLTNFMQRSRFFTHPVACVLCFPVCIIAAPAHCAYRAIFSNDKELGVKASVVYVRGTTAAEREAIRNIFQAAYIQGLADSRARAEATAAESEPQLCPEPPPYSNIESESTSTALPPSYESLDRSKIDQAGQVVDDDVEILTA